MAKRMQRWVLAGLAGALALGAAPAQAQDGGAEAASADTLGAVIVTARRRAENLQDAPVSVSAFSGQALADRQVFRSEDLDRVTPNLQFANNAPLAGNNASSQIFIRGVGQTDPTSTVDPGVGIYIDDVYQSGGVGGSMDFRDIDSIQVLRGPQGTLFGRNTIGGAIVMTTVDPGQSGGGAMRIKTGADNLFDFFAALDAPVNEAVRTRFTIGRRSQDGYVHRPSGEDLGDANVLAATGKAVFEPGGAFSARLQWNYAHADENGTPLVFAAANETAAFMRAASFDAGCPGMGDAWNATPAVPMLDDPRCANDFQAAGPFANNGAFPLKSEYQHWGLGLVLRYDPAGPLSFKSVTSYRDTDWIGVRDADNTPLTVLHTAYDVDAYDWSQEFQLSYETDRLHGVAGAYYFDGESDDWFVVLLNTPAPGVQQDSNDNIASSSNWAVFTEWTWDATERLSLTLGGRYTEDTKGSIPDQYNYADPSVKYLPVMLYETTHADFTPSATLRYRFSPAAMAYVRYAEGFKGGGWNSHFNRVQTAEEQALFQEFGPEQARSTEIGAKLDLLDDSLRLNGAVFATDYTDLQFTYRVGVAPYLANAGKASIEGFELEWMWALGRGWFLDGGVGHLDATIDELAAIAGTATGVVEGNKLPYAPDWQGNLGLSYDALLGSGWRLAPRLDVSYQDTTYFDANNTAEIAQLDPVTVWNASLTLSAPGGAWKLLAGVANISDEVYPIAGNSSLGTSSGYAEIAYDRGRSWFVGVSKGF